MAGSPAYNRPGHMSNRSDIDANPLHLSRAGARAEPCGCLHTGTSSVLCPQHSRTSADGLPLDDATAEEVLDNTAKRALQARDREARAAATLMALVTVDAGAAIAAFDAQLDDDATITEPQRLWLKCYVRVTRIMRTCGLVGIAYSTLQTWRAESPAFVQLEAQAHSVYLECLEAQLDVMAFHGVDEPVYGKLEGLNAGTGIVGYKRIRSERLAEFRMRSENPTKYRERASVELTGKDGGAIEVESKTQNMLERLRKAKEGTK
jgi:hypothetical protein